MRQHSLSSVRKLHELVHECNVQLAAFKWAVQGIGTMSDGASLRREDFPAPVEPCVTKTQIENMENMLETLENLITVHFSTSESSPTDKVTPRRRRATSCRPQCVCSKLKTSYA